MRPKIIVNLLCVCGFICAMSVSLVQTDFFHEGGVEVRRMGWVYIDCRWASKEAVSSLPFLRFNLTNHIKRIFVEIVMERVEFCSHHEGRWCAEHEWKRREWHKRRRMLIHATPRLLQVVHLLSHDLAKDVTDGQWFVRRNLHLLEAITLAYVFVDMSSIFLGNLFVVLIRHAIIDFEKVLRDSASNWF